MTRSIVVVSGGLSNPSSTRLLADQLATATDVALRGHGDAADLRVIELRELAHPLADHLLTGFPRVRWRRRSRPYETLTG